MRRTDRGFCAGVPAVGQEGDPCFLQGIRSVPTNHFNMHDVANAELYDKTAALNRLLLFLPSNEERALRCFAFSRKVTVELEQRKLAAERKAQLRAGRLIALAAQFRLLRKYRNRTVPPSPSQCDSDDLQSIWSGILTDLDVDPGLFFSKPASAPGSRTEELTPAPLGTRVDLSPPSTADTEYLPVQSGDTDSDDESSPWGDTGFNYARWGNTKRSVPSTVSGTSQRTGYRSRGNRVDYEHKQRLSALQFPACKIPFDTGQLALTFEQPNPHFHHRRLFSSFAARDVDSFDDRSSPTRINSRAYELFALSVDGPRPTTETTTADDQKKSEVENDKNENERRESGTDSDDESELANSDSK